MAASPTPGGVPEAVRGLRDVEQWLSDEQLRGIYTASYWNDIEAEKQKEWWIEDGNYDRCRRFLESSRLIEEYALAESFVREIPRHGLRVADLAAGIGWTSALLSKLSNVAELHAVEISRHRLELLFPHAISMFAGSRDKIRRYLGSFYDLQLADQSMDVVFLSQAFHHAQRPVKLMAECDRILKPGGRIIVAGEHWTGALRIVRRFCSLLVRERRILTDFRRMFPPDAVLGDHYYKKSDYYFLFHAMGYDVKHRRAATGHVIYIADKNASS